MKVGDRLWNISILEYSVYSWNFFLLCFTFIFITSDTCQMVAQCSYIQTLHTWYLFHVMVQSQCPTPTEHIPISEADNHPDGEQIPRNSICVIRAFIIVFIRIPPIPRICPEPHEWFESTSSFPIYLFNLFKICFNCIISVHPRLLGDNFPSSLKFCMQSFINIQIFL